MHVTSFTNELIITCLPTLIMAGLTCTSAFSDDTPDYVLQTVVETPCNSTNTTKHTIAVAVTGEDERQTSVPDNQSLYVHHIMMRIIMIDIH